jgi:hypothetical protein
MKHLSPWHHETNLWQGGDDMAAAAATMLGADERQALFQKAPEILRSLTCHIAQLAAKFTEVLIHNKYWRSKVYGSYVIYNFSKNKNLE